MPRFSVSSWSLHRALGPRFRVVDKETGRLEPDSDTPGDISLLELPARIAGLGIRTLEICHFHLPRLDPGYILELRAALNGAGVELFSILIDAGDITQPDPARQAEELAWIRSWLEIAGQCGASHARVIAGYAELTSANGSLYDHPLIRLSAENLGELARFGHEHGVQVITENFHALAGRPEPLLAILELCEGTVGLCADFGNYKGATKYEDLAAILPKADSIHAKAHYPQAGQMERTDFVRCLELARQANFSGPYSLIFDGPGDEWRSLAEMEQVVQPYL
jgi:sugar phosphate isomerase/epimerase